LIEVEISSRQNNSDAFAFDGEFFVDGDGGGDGSGWLDDQFQAFPENAHGGENFFLGDKSDFVNMLAENGKSERTESGAEAVSDGFGLRRRLDFAGGEGTVSVVGVFWFRADYANLRAHGFRGDGCAAQKAATADGRDDDVEIRKIFEQFEGCGALAGDDLGIVVRMDKDGAGFFLKGFAGGVAGGDVVLAFGDAAAVGLDGLAFDARGSAGHDDPCGNPSAAGSESNCAGMIAGGLRDHAELGFVVGERKNGIRGSAEFEGAGFLEIFALEEEVSAREVIE